MIAPGPIDILRAAVGLIACGRKVAMVTLVGLQGTASRSPGAQMVVADDGTYVGSFSGGCIERAVVSEALDVLSSGRGRLVRFGAGSPYLDVRLPCGGGIDLLFTLVPDSEPLDRAIAALVERRPVRLPLGEQCGEIACGREIGRFHLTYTPPLRVLAFGQGDDVTAFAKLASYYGAEVEVITPDKEAASDLTDFPGAVHLLWSRSQILEVQGDPWTAIVFLFHDHDWEEFLIPQALAMPSLYRGAIGSARTHRNRIDALIESGVTEDEIATFRGRIGLIPSARDPATLAVSVLGEIVEAYRNCLPAPPLRVTSSVATSVSRGSQL